MLFQILGYGGWTESLFRNPLLVDQELGEVPFDLAAKNTTAQFGL